MGRNIFGAKVKEKMLGPQGKKKLKTYFPVKFAF